MTLLIPIVIGVAGLATEGGWWLYAHQTLQNAADSAAVSAAASLSKGLDANSGQGSTGITTQATTQANAVMSNYCTLPGKPSTCFVPGQNGVAAAVSVSTTDPPSVKVTVTQPQTPLFSSYWIGTSSQNISATAVAIVNDKTANCILTLGNTGRGIYTDDDGTNNLIIQLTECSIFSNSSSAHAIDINGNNNAITATTIGTVGGVTWSGNNNPFSTTPTTGDPAVPDPYATVAKTWPASCVSSCTPQSVPAGSGTVSLSPGVYSGGMNLSSNNTTYNLAPGVYYVGAPGFNGGGQHILATNVTIVLTGNANFSSNNATINLTAPTTGWSAGIAIWAPPSSPLPAIRQTIALTIDNSDVANINGAIYAPDARVEYDGNTAPSFCTQIVAHSVKFSGNPGKFTGNCNNVGMLLFGRAVALVE